MRISATFMEVELTHLRCENLTDIELLRPIPSMYMEWLMDEEAWRKWLRKELTVYFNWSSNRYRRPLIQA